MKNVSIHVIVLKMLIVSRVIIEEYAHASQILLEIHMEMVVNKSTA